jgi:hypothetical protein
MEGCCVIATVRYDPKQRLVISRAISGMRIR